MDGNGHIDDFELTCVLAHITLTEVDQRLQGIFSIYDQDSSQTIDLAQFASLIESIMRIGATKDKPVASGDVTVMIANLKSNFFIKEDYVTLEKFSQIATTDREIKQALMRIGILAPDDVEEGAKDNDLELEIDKFQLADNITAEFIQRKKGVELQKVVELGILEVLSKKIENTDPTFSIIQELKKGAPDNFVQEDGATDAPNAKLQLSYIYGYRSFDMRNNIFITDEGILLYNAAQMAVRFDADANTQKFYMQSTNEIIAMDVWQDIGVTSEIAELPVLSFWNTKTMQLIVTISGLFTKGIEIIRFSSDGSTLAISTLDPYKTIYFINVALATTGMNDIAIVGQCKGPLETLLDLRFDPSDKGNNSLIAATRGDVYFIQEGVNGKVTKRATGWSGSKKIERETTLCIGFLNTDIMVGTISGKILIFKGTNVFESIQAHKLGTGVNCIVARPKGKGLISGGNDGKVIFWNPAMAKERVIDILAKAPNVLNPRVRAIAIDPRSSVNRLIIGTRSSNIIEMDLSNEDETQVIMNGHFDNELWGLAIVHGTHDIITCGQDFMVAIWDTKARQLKSFTRLPFMASKVHISPNKQYIAVGCTNGCVIILDPANLKQVHRIKDRFKEITEVRFSPDSNSLAVAGMDNQIVIYNSNGFAVKAICKGHKAAVTNLDWSLDSKYLHSNSSLLELFHWKAEDGYFIADGIQSLRNEPWADWTCIFGWQVQGIWHSTSQGLDINAVDRSQDGKHILVADDFGGVKLYKYPCVSKDSGALNFQGHSRIVTNAKFGHKGRRAFSTGASDKSIFQWDFIISPTEEGKVVDDSNFEDTELDVKKDYRRPTELISRAARACDLNVLQGLFDFAKLETGDQSFSMEKPFKIEAENSRPPHFHHIRGAKQPPDSNLYLKHAFGYRCLDCKENVLFLAEANKFIFHTGTVAIKMDIDTFGQDFFLQHDEDIVAIDLSSDKSLCVTGTICGEGQIKEVDYIVWDTSDMSERGRIGGFHNGSVKILRFSPSQNFVVSVGMDKYHTIAIHDWKNDRLVATSKADRHLVLDMDWFDETNFMTIGRRHIKFWELKFNNLNCVAGLWGQDQAEPLVSLAIINEAKAATGSAFGNIAMWTKGSPKGPNTKAHNGPIFCMVYHAGSSTLFSGGRDGIVNAWVVQNDQISTSNVKVMFDYRRSVEINTRHVGIRSVDRHNDGSLLIGVRCSEIYKLYPNGEVDTLVKAHNHGEINGLAVHPTEPLVATCGSDNSVRLWNLVESDICGMYMHTVDIVALDWAATGVMIAAGSSQGELIIFDSDLNKKVSGPTCFVGGKGGKSQYLISEIKFNRECNLIAVGARGKDPIIDLIGVSFKNGKDLALVRVSTFKNLEIGGGIIRMDWSTDGNYLALNTDQYELRYYNVKAKKITKASDTHHIDWFTWTCPFSFPTLGVFPNLLGEDVTAVCRSENRHILATGDVFQRVNLFKYPSIMPKSGCKKYTGHSSAVTRVRFMLSDNCLVSTGSKDNTVLIWVTDFGEENEHKQGFMKNELILADG